MREVVPKMAAFGVYCSTLGGEFRKKLFPSARYFKTKTYSIFPLGKFIILKFKGFSLFSRPKVIF
jgi:hypothetical protein